MPGPFLLYGTASEKYQLISDIWVIHVINSIHALKCIDLTGTWSKTGGNVLFLYGSGGTVANSWIITKNIIAKPLSPPQKFLLEVKEKTWTEIPNMRNLLVSTILQKSDQNIDDQDLCLCSPILVMLSQTLSDFSRILSLKFHSYQRISMARIS